MSDTIPQFERDNLLNIGQQIINDLYNYGVLSENYNFEEQRNVVILDASRVIITKLSLIAMSSP